MELNAVDEVCNKRLRELEIARVMHESQLENHEKALVVHEESLKTLEKLIGKITGLISQIRWLATGFCGFWVYSEIGVTESIKAFLKLLTGA